MRKAVKASLSEPVLYGTGIGEDIVRLYSSVSTFILTVLIDTLP